MLAMWHDHPSGPVAFHLFLCIFCHWENTDERQCADPPIPAKALVAVRFLTRADVNAFNLPLPGALMSH